MAKDVPDPNLANDHQSIVSILDRSCEGRNPATSFLSTCFQAGVPIRQALNATQSRHGLLAWNTTQAQNALLHDTIILGQYLQSVLQDFTFGALRCARFIRLLLDEIDHSCSDIDEELALCAAASCTAVGTAHQPHRWLLLRLPCTGRADHAGRDDVIAVCVADDFGKVGLRVWEAGLVMYAHIMRENTPLQIAVHGKRVLEVGSGTGISARALLQTGVQKAYLTDLPHVMDNLQRNLSANGIRHDGARDIIQTPSLDISDASDGLKCVNEWRIDTIIAADVTFDDALIVHLANFFHMVLNASKRVVYLFVTCRNERTDLLMWRQFTEKHQLNVEKVELTTCDWSSFDYLVQCDFTSVYALRITCSTKCLEVVSK